MLKLNINALLMLEVGFEESDAYAKQEEYKATLINAPSKRVVWVGKAAIKARALSLLVLKVAGKHWRNWKSKTYLGRDLLTRPGRSMEKIGFFELSQ